MACIQARGRGCGATPFRHRRRGRAQGNGWAAASPGNCSPRTMTRKALRLACRCCRASKKASGRLSYSHRCGHRSVNGLKEGAGGNGAAGATAAATVTASSTAAGGGGADGADTLAAAGGGSAATGSAPAASTTCSGGGCSTGKYRTRLLARMRAATPVTRWSFVGMWPRCGSASSRNDSMLKQLLKHTRSAASAERICAQPNWKSRSSPPSA